MPGEAKYTIMVPVQDNLGNALADIATAAHKVLFYGPMQVQGSYVEPGKRGNWRDDPQEVFDHLITFAPDSPEMDSHIKQLAAYVADIANQWGVYITKESKNGPQTWVIRNALYRAGQPADPVALANPQGQGPGQVFPVEPTPASAPASV